MHILVIIHNQRGAGPYSKVFGMCLAVKELGNAVTILCTSPAARAKFSSSVEQGITVWESPDLLGGRLRQGVDLWNALRRIGRLRAERFDVVHAIDCRPVVILPALWMKYVHGVPLLLSWWDLFGSGGSATERSGRLYALTFGHIETLFERHFRKYADRATVVSTELRRRLEKLGFPREKITLQRVGVSVGDFPKAERTKARALLNLPADSSIFCFVGSIFESDMRLLLGALRALKTTGEKMPLTVVIGNHDIDAKVCRELNIVLPGRVDDESFRRFFAASDYALLPLKDTIANRARWPSKVGDYLAAGLPVVTTPVGDFSNLLTEHHLGYRAATDSAKDFASAMVSAVRAKTSMRKRKSDSARRYARTALEWSVLAPGLVTNYDSLLKKT